MQAKIYISNGDKTAHALKMGYIQVPKNSNSPAHIYLTYADTFYIVKGFNSQGKSIYKKFTSIQKARKALELYSII